MKDLSNNLQVGNEIKKGKTYAELIRQRSTFKNKTRSATVQGNANSTRQASLVKSKIRLNIEKKSNKADIVPKSSRLSNKMKVTKKKSK